MKKSIIAMAVILFACCLCVVAPAKTQALSKSPSTTVCATKYTPLKYGSKGAKVKSLQKKLAELGYYSGSIDGKYGPLTRSAVIRFQRAAKIKVDGKAGNQTQTALYSANAPKNPNSVSYAVTYTADDSTYYNIKLTKSQQDTVRSLCKKYNVSFEMVLALMSVESGYKTTAKSSTNDYGIMQINKSNHAYLKRTLGVSNFLDFEDNAKAGIYMLSRYTAKHSDIHKVLMCYNLGEGAAAKKWKKGTLQTSYSLKVVAKMETLEKL